MKKIVALCLALSVGAQASMACTTIIVGRNATNDGSILVARSVDGVSGNVAVDYVYHPPRRNGYLLRSQLENRFWYQMPANLMGYTGSPDHRTNGTGFEESGFNDVGVGVSATETIFSNEATLKVDPYATDDGIVEEVIPTIILPQAKSARDGVQMLGQLIERYGSAEGFGVAFVDKREAWYLENAGGHEWLAQRIPDDSYFVSANQSRLGVVDLNDRQNVLSSPRLAQWAAQHGLYGAKRGQAFNFREIFGRDEQKDAGYNYPRVEYLQGRYTHALAGVQQTANRFPTFARPDHLLSVAEIENSLQNHFQGTAHDPYGRVDPAATTRPISVFRTYQSHVLQTRANLPAPIANVEYLSLGMSALSVYVPFYEGASIPASYRGAGATADDHSAFWTFRRLQTLAMQNFPKYGPLVRRRFDAFAVEIATRQKTFETRYSQTYARDPSEAKRLLDSFTNQTVDEALQAATELSNEIISDMALTVNKQFSFEGA
ncbi:C69 family dipeptidase [Trinickia soli]|uniref:Dipeptidase n=1 Tax=Trinickia soli TaxID=380675 RepID=A0A2N7VWB5_9BURK|nr:C69 family dipeptidase [Trinickia soli]PMS21446.1 peptidase U34 [Trinickia soli]CAB3698609.1 Dipeptidase A [Trinickia soli]